MNDQQILDALSTWFPRELEYQKKGRGGSSLTYVAVSEVIARANEVLGLNWSYRTVSAQRYADDGGDWVVAHVEVTINLPDGRTVTRDGHGGQDVSRMKNGNYVDLGDEYKGAVSDALKKALMSFGIALYLSRDDRIGSTFAGEAAGEAPGAPPSNNPEQGTSGRAPGADPVPGLDDLKELAARATELGISPPDLLAACAEALGRPVASAGDIHTYDELEAINRVLDARQSKEDSQ